MGIYECRAFTPVETENRDFPYPLKDESADPHQKMCVDESARQRDCYVSVSLEGFTDAQLRMHEGLERRHEGLQVEFDQIWDEQIHNTHMQHCILVALMDGAVDNGYKSQKVLKDCEDSVELTRALDDGGIDAFVLPDFSVPNSRVSILWKRFHERKLYDEAAQYTVLALLGAKAILALEDTANCLCTHDSMAMDYPEFAANNNHYQVTQACEQNWFEEAFPFDELWYPEEVFCGCEEVLEEREVVPTQVTPPVINADDDAREIGPI